MTSLEGQELTVNEGGTMARASSVGAAVAKRDDDPEGKSPGGLGIVLYSSLL